LRCESSIQSVIFLMRRKMPDKQVGIIKSLPIENRRALRAMTFGAVAGLIFGAGIGYETAPTSASQSNQKVADELSRIADRLQANEVTAWDIELSQLAKRAAAHCTNIEQPSDRLGVKGDKIEVVNGELSTKDITTCFRDTSTSWRKPDPSPAVNAFVGGFDGFALGGGMGLMGGVLVFMVAIPARAERKKREEQDVLIRCHLGL
jgi:hypothetical protein